MTALGKRVDALERDDISDATRLHVIMCYKFETDDEAVAAYEQKNGPIGSDQVLRVVVAKPGPRPSSE